MSRGFTLIELVVYLGLLFIFTSLVIGFVPDLVRAYGFAQAQEGVLTNARNTINIIKQDLRQADSIYTPTSVFVSSTSQLSLETTLDAPPDEETGYVDYFLDSGQIYKKAEGENAIMISPEDMEVLDFRLTHLYPNETHQSVRISIRMRKNTTSALLQDKSDVSLNSTASLRTF